MGAEFEKTTRPSVLQQLLKFNDRETGLLCQRGSLYQKKCDEYGGFVRVNLIGENWREMMVNRNFV